jgi:hypothetical protein
MYIFVSKKHICFEKKSIFLLKTQKDREEIQFKLITPFDIIYCVL